MPDDWSLRLLGPAELRCGDATLLLEGRRHHRLLAYLAARADWLRREQLAALFWPDRSEAAARSNLRKVILLAHQELHHLARNGAAAAAPIEDHAGALRWRITTDTELFVQHAQAARHDEAIALYRGPLLQGLDDEQESPFNEWLAFERSRLAERWRTCVLRAAEQAISPAQRAALAARLVARDPLDETAVRLLLASLTASGRQADARRALSTYSRQLVQETGLEASAELHALCEGATAAAAAGPRAAAAVFFGRHRELAAIEGLVSAASAQPLVIVGPGGIGKSRLLREAARRFAPQLAHGAACVDLHGLRDADALPEHIARTLAVTLVGANDPWTALSVHLRQRAMLLALDSFDHLSDAAPRIDRLQADCPALRIVISSRVRPALAAATLLSIDGLTCPQADDHDIEAFDAVQLFAHHARRARAEFALEDEADAVAQICRLVDGLPLALELAASWVRLFRCADIASDLQRDLELLRDADGERASSVTTLLEQSWSLLVPRERQTLAVLAVFRGPFDREAVRAVAGASLAVVGALLDKSLLRGDGDARLSLHPLVQRFAEQRLHAGDAACTAQQARHRHAEHYSQVLAGLALPAIDVNHSLATVGLDLENFCAAWQTAVELRDAAVLSRCVDPLGHYFLNRGPHKPALALLDAAEPLLRQSAPHATALLALLRRRAGLHYRSGELGLAEADAQLALSLAGAGTDPTEHRRLLNLKGILAWARGDLGAAQAAFEQALQGSDSDRDPLLADLLGNLGLIAQARGRFDDARERFAAALAQHRRMGSQIGVVQQLMNLGTVCWALRQWREVVRLMSEALALARAIHFAEHRPYGLRVMGLAHLELGDTAAARRCVDSALTLLDEGAEPLQRTIVLVALCLVELAEGRIDAAATTLRDAALAAVGGALAHDRIAVIHAWGTVLFAQGRIESAAILWLFAAAHPSTLADDRPKVQASLARARDRLAPEAQAACERRAGQLDLDSLLTQAVSMLAPLV